MQEREQRTSFFVTHDYLKWEFALAWEENGEYKEKTFVFKDIDKVVKKHLPAKDLVEFCNQNKLQDIPVFVLSYVYNNKISRNLLYITIKLPCFQHYFLTSKANLGIFCLFSIFPCGYICFSHGFSKTYSEGK